MANLSLQYVNLMNCMVISGVGVSGGGGYIDGLQCIIYKYDLSMALQ